MFICAEGTICRELCHGSGGAIHDHPLDAVRIHPALGGRILLASTEQRRADVVAVPLPRPRRPRHRLRPHLHASQEDQHLHRAGRPKAWHQGGRRRNLDRQLHALRSRIHRSGAENLATPRQPVRPEVVTHVLGTFCHPCVRAGHRLPGGPERTRTSDLRFRKPLLYPAELRDHYVDVVVVRVAV